MTTMTNRPTPVILDDADLLELEIRPYDDVDGRHMARLTVAERDALCQTVRALQDELKVADDALETQVKWVGELRKENAALSNKVCSRDNTIHTLQSRLAQVEKERDGLRTCDVCKRPVADRTCRLHGRRL